MPENARHGQWGLYLISGLDMLRQETFLPLLRDALEGGLRIAQIRGKHLPRSLLLETGRQALRLTRACGALLIVNDDVELALELGADGVHLGQEDRPPEQVRPALAPGMLIGLSTHNLAQVRDAARRPVDYIGVGPVFPTTTKENPDPVVGLDFLREAVRESPHPTVAIGGVTRPNLPQVLDTGTPNVAVISGISRADDPAEETRRILADIAARRPRLQGDESDG